MMMAMAVVITQNAAIVLLRQEVIDKRKVVSSDLTISSCQISSRINPRPNAQRTGEISSTTFRNLLLGGTMQRLSQVGHDKPYLKPLKLKRECQPAA